jgi:hypothetical protein
MFLQMVEGLSEKNSEEIEEQVVNKDSNNS